jgi:type IV pilus assembly protein PilY1
MKHKYSVLILSLLTVVSLGVSAHDTDIYINTSAAASVSDPLVMFSLDLRSSTGSTFCPTSNTNCDFLYNNYDYVPDTTDPDTVGVQGDPLNGGQAYLTTRPTTQMNVLRAVIKYVVNRVSGVKVGLMLNHNSNNNCAGPSASGCSNGGYILYGFQPLTDKANFFAKLDAVPTAGGNTAHPYQGRELYFELFRYLTGQGVYNGKLGYKDYGNNSASGNLDTEFPSMVWDSSIISGSNYIAPPMDNCTKVYAVNFVFGNSQSESDSDTAIAGTVAGGGLGANPSSLYSYNPDGTFAPMVRWMYEHDMTNMVNNYAPSPAGTKNVTSYFIIPGNPTSARQNMASAGQGQSGTGINPYLYSDDPKTLVDTLTNLFQRILSTSTTFTAPSVAVNVYNRAQTLSDVYFAMFQADQDGKPLWTGNLKKFTISGLQVLDANATQAIAGDGRVENTALSYWTDPSAPSLQVFDTAKGIFAGKDGRHVARGGCGQRIPGWEDTGSTPGLTNPGGKTTLTTARKLFTEPASYTNGTSTALLALEATTTTADALFSSGVFGAATTTVGTCATSDTDSKSACNLIKYARGLNDDATQRNWLVADPLHSKPLPINYGAINSRATTNPDVRIVMGTNDGYLRMIRNTSNGGAQEGIEAWAFMPREAMATLATLKTNATASPISHPITVDGAPAAYIKDENKNGNIESGDKVYVYFGLRRGGKSYYALDVSDPDEPKILWKINKNDAGGAFAELGETWSTPRVASMLVDGSDTPTPVLIFGGGYDNNKDDSHEHHAGANTVGTNDSQGNAIFIVHAETGALIWKAVKGTTPGYTSSTKAYTHPGLVDSIPSDVAAVDSNGNGLIDRLYVGDTGGVVWRVDTVCSHPSGVNVVSGSASPGCGATTADAKPWQIIPILSVGRHYSSTLANDRRFFYAPDYVQTVMGTTNYDAVIVGTGDRENPKSTSATDWFYMFKDKDIDAGVLVNNTGTPLTHADLGDITECTVATCINQNDIVNGWRLKLECPTEGFTTPCGEKNLSTAVTIGGAIYFSTYIPKAGLSSNCQLLEGSGALYVVGVQNGNPVCTTANCNPATLIKTDRAEKVTSGGIPAEIVQLGDGRILKPGMEGDTTLYPPGLKTYWYKK